MPYHTPGNIYDDARAPDPQSISPKCRLSSLFGLSHQDMKFKHRILGKSSKWSRNYGPTCNIFYCGPLIYLNKIGAPFLTPPQ